MIYPCLYGNVASFGSHCFVYVPRVPVRLPSLGFMAVAYQPTMFRFLYATMIHRISAD